MLPVIRVKKNQRKIPKSKYVEDYWIEKYPSGIILLCFNTRKRWIQYGRVSDEHYTFNQYIDKGDDNFHLDPNKEEMLELTPFLPNNGSRMIHVHEQEKDQIYHYFIPFKLISKKR